MFDLSKYQSELIQLCHSLRVRRLDLVGAAARENFHKETSDIDVLIEFEGTEELFDRYFDLKFGLEGIFERNVDVIQEGALKNPYLRESIEQDRIVVYEA